AFSGTPAGCLALRSLPSVRTRLSSAWTISAMLDRILRALVGCPGYRGDARPTMPPRRLHLQAHVGGDRLVAGDGGLASRVRGDGEVRERPGWGPPGPYPSPRTGCRGRGRR